jgi:hypothetical protein
VHFAVERYLPYTAIRRAWAHGFIDIRMLSDLPVGSGAVGEAHKAAEYLSKTSARTSRSLSPVVNNGATDHIRDD